MFQPRLHFKTKTGREALFICSCLISFLFHINIFPHFMHHPIIKHNRKHFRVNVLEKDSHGCLFLLT